MTHRGPDPVLGLLCCAVLAVPALLSHRPLTLVLLAVPVLLLGVARLGPVRVLRRAVPVLVGVAGVAGSNALLAPGAGVAWATGATAGLQVLAVALPGALLAALIDPTDLADALVQHLHLPARFAYGAVAALRLVPLLQLEWTMLGRARRARGVQGGRDPVAVVRLFAATCFALVVAAVRRATGLAQAMDARGFDLAGPPARTAARTAHVRRSDVGLLLAALALAVAAPVVARGLAAAGWAG